MQFEVGTIVEGKVKGITNFGAFVELDEGKTGMVHISEVSRDYVKDINEYLKKGQVVKAKVVKISDKGEIGLSIRKAENDSAKKETDKSPRKFRSESFDRRTLKKPVQKASFEDMLSMFKAASEEKMSDLKRATESKRGGYSRRRVSK